MSYLCFRENLFQVSDWQRKKCQVQCGLHPPSLTLLGCPLLVCLCQKSSSFCVIRLPLLAWLPLSSAHGNVHRSKVPQQSLLKGFWPHCGTSPGSYFSPASHWLNDEHPLNCNVLSSWNWLRGIGASVGPHLLKRSKVKEAALKGWVLAVVRPMAQGSTTKEGKLKLIGLSSTNWTVYKHVEGRNVFCRCPLSPPSKAVEWGLGRGQKQAEIAL